MIMEVTEERKARKRAEQLQQEAEDEVNAHRKEREARLRAETNEETKEEDNPLAYLLQKARDKSAALEDNIFELNFGFVIPLFPFFSSLNRTRKRQNPLAQL
jgi:hypothetical protein